MAATRDFLTYADGAPDRAQAVVFDGARRVAVRELALTPAGRDDVVVDVAWSGVSAGTERLLWSGDMPPFPGHGYPLVPGYESVGRIVAGPDQSLVGRLAFAPGATCYEDAYGLFGGAASRLVAPAARVTPVPDELGERATLLALAATARRAVRGLEGRGPQLIVGHGALGRLVARIARALGGPDAVFWEVEPARAVEDGFPVRRAEDDPCTSYETIVDVSGDADALDRLIGRLARGGDIVLAGFYAKRVSFAFPPAFMKEARLRVSAEWAPEDLQDVLRLVSDGDVSLDGLVTHRRAAADAVDAYETAFGDPSCLKMILDWRRPQ
ncbi:MAG: chlorophyll synthesis pathway protein BchC [Parvularculaceae bacterium]